MASIYLIAANRQVAQRMARRLRQAGSSCRVFSRVADFLLAPLDMSDGCVLLDPTIPECAKIWQQRELPVVALMPMADIDALVEAMDKKQLMVVSASASITFIDNKITQAIMCWGRAKADEEAKAERLRLLMCLTPRERHTFQLLAEGHTNVSAADIMYVSFKAVEVYRGNLMQKLNVKRFADLMILYGQLVADGASIFDRA